MTTAVPGDALTAERCYGASPVDAYRHTMSFPSLLRYLEIKVHHLVDEREWSRIRVVGGYDRGCVISAKEKTDKLFNWQRPTAEARGDELTVKCYPGRDYVYHYALIIATYLSMRGRYRGQVDYELPTEDASRSAVDRLDVDLSGAHLVVVGWGLTHLVGNATWTHGHGCAWHRRDVEGRQVVYLGYLHSIWGDVAGRVVTRLAGLGARRIVYVGKVGSLDPSVVPNTWLATGNRSVLDGQTVTWRDYFDGIAAAQSGIRAGIHVSSPSILLEDQNWLRRQGGHSFVDPEIGHMGRAAHQAGVDFGYLHIVSNNLAAREYAANLSNERLGTVVHRRAQLLDRIDAVLRLRLRQPDPSTDERSARP